MIRIILSLVLALGVTATDASVGVKVTALDLNLQGENGFIIVKFDGRASELPDVRVFDKTIEIVFENSSAFSPISKTIRGAELSAEVVNGKALIKAVLPYEIPAQSINMSWNKNDIEIIFPRGIAKSSPAPVTQAPAPVVQKTTRPAEKTTVQKSVSKVSKEELNEDYLNKLMNDTTAKADKFIENGKKDEINTKQASAVQNVNENISSSVNKNDNFSFAGYAAKFTTFLAVVLALFYGVIQLLKKGVFSRGKLGFLNNTQMIEVLSTTYVSPKRTLMVVRAHKQIFLVANSESGFTFLSEMTDTAGIVKEGERHLTGTNFDLNLLNAEDDSEEKFKIKEDIMDSTPIPDSKKGLQKLVAAKDDVVKFSDELKKKARKLKPIEFN